jgi:hypothetical protein
MIYARKVGGGEYGNIEQSATRASFAAPCDSGDRSVGIQHVDMMHMTSIMSWLKWQKDSRTGMVLLHTISWLFIQWLSATGSQKLNCFEIFLVFVFFRQGLQHGMEHRSSRPVRPVIEMVF